MSNHAVLDVPRSLTGSSETIERSILDQIDEQAVIGLDALTALLPGYSWSQIFHAVDRLARCHKLTLRRHRCEYTIFSTHYAS